MDNKKNVMGLTPKERIYEKYENKFYVVNPNGTNDHHAGKIKKINTKAGLITLNPHYGLKYNIGSKKNLFALINEDYDLFTELNKISFESTDEEDLLRNCELNNKEIIKNELKSKSFFGKLKLAYEILVSK
ncbi:MAG: hypothetical protein Q8O84_05635 [Nanoarchaeota archaeon]|nr:hypothetical protein [Nanoarchaeota archaeon]